MCLFENCFNKIYAKEFCRKHYRAKRDAGDFGQYRKRVLWGNGKCEIKDCPDPIHAKGFCVRHYSRLSRNGDALIVQRISKYTTSCQVIYPNGIECDKKVSSKNYCSVHYNSWKRYGDPLTDKSRKLNSNNYVTIYVAGHPNAHKNGRILEHRFVMSEHLGRPLFEDENVHHINGDRHDNRIENLELWSSAQPAGQRVEDKLKWAFEMIQRYKDYGHLDAL